MHLFSAYAKNAVLMRRLIYVHYANMPMQCSAILNAVKTAIFR